MRVQASTGGPRHVIQVRVPHSPHSDTCTFCLQIEPPKSVNPKRSKGRNTQQDLGRVSKLAQGLP